MINPFQPGDRKTFEHQVRTEDRAVFQSGEVHAVYSTFALGRDAEWACRLFVLEMKEEGEEGIGTFLKVTHHSPALIGQRVMFTSRLESVNRNEVICSFEAHVGDRLIATGETGQKILKKEKLDGLMKSLE